MKEKHIGKCAICGAKNVELTKEHIPPQSAYNCKRIKVINNIMQSENNKNQNDDTILNSDDIWQKGYLDESLSTIFANSETEIIQGGYSRYCLCQMCNNNTGKWYGKEYKHFVNEIVSTIENNDHLNLEQIEIVFNNIYPLMVIKQIIAMFCDITPDLKN